jgi:hypothetical protein
MKPWGMRAALRGTRMARWRRDLIRAVMGPLQGFNNALLSATQLFFAPESFTA